MATQVRDVRSNRRLGGRGLRENAMRRTHVRALGAAAVALVLAAGSRAGAQTPRYSLGILGKYTPDGMLVQSVTPGSPMDRAGVQRGDLILKIDGQLIQNQDDLVAVINSSGGSVLL